MKPWRFLSSVFLVLALSLSALPQAFADQWEDVGVTDGVKVSRMQVSGSNMFAFRGELVADVHISQLMAVFIDSNERPNWVDRYHSHRTIERVERPESNEMWELYMIRFSLPPGISDRDYIIRTDLEVDPGRKVVTARLRSVVDRRAPEDSCCVRAYTETFYEFTAIPGQNRTRMIVEVHTDPKGRLPAWLVNRIQRDWPSDTLASLLARARASGVRNHPDYTDWH